MIADLEAAGARGPALERLRADLAFSRDDIVRALDLYASLAAKPGADTQVVERAATLALRLGRLDQAAKFIGDAVLRPDASWRAWNAKGAAADLVGDYAGADAAYHQAQRLAPERAEIANNQGWSLLLRGQWQAAVHQLERAYALDPNTSRLANNLEIARAGIALDLPLRKPKESDASWAARLNDAGVAAAIKGDNRRAVAAFSQAIVASRVWNVRSAANLAQVQGSQ
jgi:Flp pilus assembly protein TadD